MKYFLALNIYFGSLGFPQWIKIKLSSKACKRTFLFKILLQAYVLYHRSQIIRSKCWWALYISMQNPCFFNSKHTGWFVLFFLLKHYYALILAEVISCTFICFKSDTSYRNMYLQILNFFGYLTFSNFFGKKPKPHKLWRFISENNCPLPVLHSHFEKNNKGKES